MLALASPASLKGRSRRRRRPRRCSPPGCVASPGLDVDELPVADGGEGTAAVLTAALGGAWHTAQVGDPLGRPVAAAGCCWTTALRSSSPPRRSACRCSRRSELDPLRATSRGLGELLLAALADDGRRRCSFASAGTATVDGGAACARSSASGCAACRSASLCDVRNPLLGAARRGARLRPAEGRGSRGGRGARGAPRRDRGARSVPRPARGGSRRRARRGVRGARRRARRGCRARARHDRLRRACPRRRSSSPARAPSTRRRSREGARRRRRAAASASASAASSSAASSGAACGARAVRPPGAGRRRPLRLGEELARALVGAG